MTEDSRIEALRRRPLAAPPPPAESATEQEPVDPALPVLERWLTAIVADRARPR